MGLRRPTTGATILPLLKGRTLRDIVERATSLKLICDHCDRAAVWPWPRVKNEARFKPLLDRPIHAVADKLRCATCRSRDLHVTIYTGALASPPTW